MQVGSGLVVGEAVHLPIFLKIRKRESKRGYVPNLVEDFETYQVAEEPKFEQMKDLF